MRPLYETEEHLEAEEKTAAVLAKAWNCQFHKMPIRYNLDFVAKRGDIALAFCEFKTRTYTMAQIDSMGGYLLSIGKWSAAKTICEASGLPFTLIVSTNDGIWYYTVKDFKPDSVLVRGRKDRHDWQDIEPCVLLKTSRFTKFHSPR